MSSTMGSKRNKKKPPAPSSGASSPSVSSAPPAAPKSASHASVEDVLAVNNSSPDKTLRTTSVDSTECIEITQEPAEVKNSGAECESVGGNEYGTSAGMNPQGRMDRIGGAGNGNGGRDSGSKAGSSNEFSDSYGNKEGENDSVSNMPLHDSTGCNGEASQGSGSEFLEGGGSTDEVVSGAREGAAVRLSDLDSIVRDLKQQLAIAEVESQKLREELAEANAGRDKSEARLGELQENKTEVLMALEQAGKKVACLEEELEAAKEREAGLAGKLREKEDDILGLRKAVKDLEAGELSKTSSEMQQMEGEVENGKTQLQTLERERQQEVEKLKERLQELESAAASRAAEVKAERERADVAEKKLAEVQSGLGGEEKVNGKVAEMEKELSTLRVFKETSEDKLKKRQAVMDSLTRSCSEKESGIRALGCQLQTLREDSAGLHNELAGVHESREAIIKKAREMDSSVMNCAAENEMLKIELVQLSKREWGPLALTTLFTTGAITAATIMMRYHARREGA